MMYCASGEFLQEEANCRSFAVLRMTPQWAGMEWPALLLPAEANARFILGFFGTTQVVP
jgi:hypothetical protein